MNENCPVEVEAIVPLVTIEFVAAPQVESVLVTGLDIVPAIAQIEAPVQICDLQIANPQSQVDGPYFIIVARGLPGEDGESAYQIAVDNGFVGTEQEWLDSLNGESAYQTAVDEGFVGTEAEWIASLHGLNGATAYQIAVAEGFVGTQAEWVASLEGTPGTNGDDGLSAYQIAVQDGFVGTEQEWLDSLQGTPGDDGMQYVFFQNTDPVIDYPAINFKADWPDPEVVSMLVFEP